MKHVIKSIVRHALFIERDAAMTPIAITIVLTATALLLSLVYLCTCV